MSKLIVLRGNSGSGKTTIAKALQKSWGIIQCLYHRMKSEEICYGLKMAQIPRPYHLWRNF